MSVVGRRPSPIGRHVALVARGDKARPRLAIYLRDCGFEVFECDDLAIPSRFGGLVVFDDLTAPGERGRVRVRSWIKLTTLRRVVVVTPQPADWQGLAHAYSDRLFVLAAPALGWHIVEALRGRLPDEPRRA